METNLSNREREVLNLVIADFSSKDISKQLELSQRTVEAHRTNINRKTACKTHISLLKYSIKKGWVKGYYYKK